MTKMQFLNQKLGKRRSRQVALAKARLSSPARLPKRLASARPGPRKEAR